MVPGHGTNAHTSQREPNGSGAKTSREEALTALSTVSSTSDQEEEEEEKEEDLLQVRCYL